MATTHEKREEYSSNVIRVLHPMTNQPPSSNVSHVDNNLDYLLEDLQSSVAPNTYISSRRDVQYLSPSNTATIVHERSQSPGTEKRTYKSAAYQFSTATGSESQQNVNQLDTLLQDLKTERDITRERDFSQISNTGIESFRGPPADVTKSAHVYKTIVTENKPISQRELVFDSFDHSTLQGSPQKPNANYVKKVETKTIRDVAYDRANRHDVISNESAVITPHSTAITLDTESLPAELKDVTLSNDILPVPGTKVTTTVRTYTYEIPAEPISTSAKTLLYKTESQNVENVNYPERTVPPTVVFKTESYNTINRNDAFSSPIQPQSNITTVTRKIDTRDINRSVHPPLETYQPSPHITNIYEQDVTNIENIHPDPNWNPKYQTSPKPAKTGPTTTYYYKHESSNTKNTIYSPQPENPPHLGPEQPILPGTTFDYKPHPDSGHPDKSTITSYKYSSLNTTSNTQRSPGEREPLLQPGPFPTDGVDHSGMNGSPPKRLDALMASFNGNDRSGPVDETISQRKEVETAVATPGEPKIPSKNIAGPPVYYPPGHEMFVRKEEGAAAYRAQGGYSRASGRYEYEAESKSKSKSRSGAAVVPVCLPLCCAMPCSIM